jgi:hypothetical protein
MPGMRFAILFALGALTLNAADSVTTFGRAWAVPYAADWKLDGGILRLVVSRGPLPGPRRPIQFALTEVPKYDRLTVEADVMPLARSLMIVFAYRDAAHFDYAHLSIDTAAREPHHNGIFHVYDGERVRISAESGPAPFAASGRWYHVRLTHDARAGDVRVMVDGRDVPALHAVDLSLGAGQVGIGSFDETAAFRDLKITTAAPER